MANIINGEVIFHCECCHKEVKRKAEPSDYLGRCIMPNGWGYWRILTNFMEFCDNYDCQSVLDRCTVDYPIDNAPTKN